MVDYVCSVIGRSMNKLFYYGSGNNMIGVGPNMDERVLRGKVCPLPSPPPFSIFGERFG